MSQFLPISPETDVSLGSLYVRHDLVSQSVTIYLKPWVQWDLNTQEVNITTSIIHFVEPDGDLVGIKSFASNGFRVGGTL
jgi:hypothetical protein